MAARSAGDVIRSNGHCSTCGQILAKIPLLPQLKYAIACDNSHCSLHRSPLYYIDIPVDQKPDPKPASIIHKTPSRLAYDKVRKDNYHLLRSIGVPSRDAARMNTIKQTNYYLESKGLAQNGYIEKCIS